MHLLSVNERFPSYRWIRKRGLLPKGEGKKRARDVKIRKNKCRGIAEGKKADSEKRVKQGECVHAREPEFARVSNILFLLALAKLIERGRYPHSPSCIFFFSFSPTFNKARSVWERRPDRGPPISDRQKSRQKGANRIAESIHVLFHSRHRHFDREDIGVLYVPWIILSPQSCWI